MSMRVILSHTSASASARLPTIRGVRCWLLVCMMVGCDVGEVY